jgi:outer membrane protein W
MYKTALTILSVILISSLGFGELKLKLSTDLTGESTQSLINKNVESRLNLNLPSEVPPPAEMKEFAKGMMLLGILADASFPMGSDSGFKHIAGTAWSGHLEFSYFLSPVFRLTFRGGYINFGTQSEEGTDPYDYSYEDTFTQIPLLIGGYYMFQTGGGFKPYIGLAAGAFFQTYSVNWYEDFGFGEPFVLDESFSNTGFGIVPGIGFYYAIGSVMLQLAAEYTYIFSDGPTVEYDTNVPAFRNLNKTSGIAQDETDEEDNEKPSYFSGLLGVSVQLGQ